MQKLQFFLGGRLNKIMALKKFDYNQWNKNAADIYNSRKEFLNDYRSHFEISNGFFQYVETFFKYAYYLQLIAPLHFSSNDSSFLPGTYYIQLIAWQPNSIAIRAF